MLGAQKQRLYFKAIWIACLAATAFGCLIRFYGLDQKFFTIDEVKTAQQVGGYYEFDKYYDRLTTAGEMTDCKPIRDASSWKDTLNVCISQTSFNPPTYFILARFWAENFGVQPASLRTLSCLISLLIVPGFFLFSMSLFRAPLAAAITTALAMGSPALLPLGQIARPYSLWLVLTLFSSALFIKAAKSNSRSQIIGYFATTLLSLYTHLSALRVLLSNVLYLIVERGSYQKKTLIGLLAASVASFACFMPWLEIMDKRLVPFYRADWFFKGSVTFPEILQSWYFQSAQIIVDLEQVSTLLNILVSPLAVLVELALVAYFFRVADKRSRNFLITLHLTTLFTLAIPDLLGGAGRSAEARYMMPCMIAVITASGFALYTLVSSKNKWLSIAGNILLMAIISTGIASCVSSLRSTMLWNNNGQEIVRAAQYINAAPRPVILGTQRQLGWPDQLMSLMPLLRRDVVVAFSKSDRLLEIAEQDRDIFLWEPTEKQLNDFSGAGNFRLKKCEIAHLSLWKLLRTKRSP